MISFNKNYVNELSQMKIFANQSFAQIELDLPRLNFLNITDDKKINQIRDICGKVLFNYTKRNSIYQYI